MSICRHTPHNSWWVNDARGIPVAQVCDECKGERLSGYRRDIFSDPNYEADEPIEPDEGLPNDTTIIEAISILQNRK